MSQTTSHVSLLIFVSLSHIIYYIIRITIVVVFISHLNTLPLNPSTIDDCYMMVSQYTHCIVIHHIILWYLIYDLSLSSHLQLSIDDDNNICISYYIYYTYFLDNLLHPFILIYRYPSPHKFLYLLIYIHMIGADWL